VALILAAMGLGYEMAQNGFRGDIREIQEQKLQAQIAAAVSKAEAEANEAKVNARVAVKEVETLCAELKADGIKNIDCH